MVGFFVIVFSFKIKEPFRSIKSYCRLSTALIYTSPRLGNINGAESDSTRLITQRVTITKLNHEFLNKYEVKVTECRETMPLTAGGMAEKPVVGGIIGPTFACILGQQFLNLRKGDRQGAVAEADASVFNTYPHTNTYSILHS
jgi:hypothetical protein